MYYVVGGVVFLVVFFIWWRWSSVKRGALARDERLNREISDISQKLTGKEDIDAATLKEKAERPELRRPLYALLKQHNRLDLFPEELLKQEEQARAELAWWLCHPNELGVPPDEIEHLTRVEKVHKGATFIYHAMRFRKNEPHWAASEGWMVGVAGPFKENDKPFTRAGAFSRFRPESDVSAEEHVDWYHNKVCPPEQT